MSRRRSNSPRRAWSVLKPLLLVAVIAAVSFAGFKLYPQWSSGDSEATELTVRYRTDAPAATTVAKPWLEVVNTSEKTVALSDVTVRYYFSADESAPYGSNCVETHVDCSNITTKIVELPDPTLTAGHYLQVGFTQAAGSLKPGETSKGIGLQLYRLDHKRLNQADDHSFDAKVTHYAPSKLVTGHLRGVLVWGEGPNAGTSAAGQDSMPYASAPAMTAPPTGILFDNFRYSGHDDPALIINGWSARTGAGGPGIRDTWAPENISFPAAESAQGGQAMRLRVTTDGTEQGTKQAEMQSNKAQFLTGTCAARIYFSDKPTDGSNGDHINESFFTISHKENSPKYSELDFEYMPNGGWGAPGPRLDTTTWKSSKDGDNVTRALKKKPLQGWHTLMITAMDGKVTYSLDGRELFTSGSKYFPREHMGIHFSAWLVDLPFTGPRTWDMKVNWLYCQADQAVPLADVQKAVDGFYESGTRHVNTLPTS
ncbi:cellulose binding domain-containing protein [Streptomyces sp. TRM49041]|uniref:cellulose binding domain-containing protein n=1 Tax=Streptomyces sp. TRM49041 TaxID=2603216 RepID=UPI0011EDCDDE|nr:cellulose binding domain-containing protein [Streptomyces sp. TRM49041]